VGTNADQVTNFTVKVRIDSASYSALINKSAKNPSPFRPGLTSTVDIQTNRTKSLSVPIQSVTTRDDKKKARALQPNLMMIKKPKPTNEVKTYVFIYEAGKVKQVAVTTGIQDDSYIQILKRP
jgi:HlyD family secretion protein